MSLESARKFAVCALVIIGLHGGSGAVSQLSAQTSSNRFSSQIDDLDPDMIESERIEGTVGPAARAGATEQSSSRQMRRSNSGDYFNPTSQQNDQPNPPIQLQSRAKNTRGNNADSRQQTSSRQPQQRQIQSFPPPAPEGMNSASRNNTRQKRQPFRNASTPTRATTMPANAAGMNETRSTPSVQTQIVAPRSINVNQTARLFLQAQNVGQNNVESVKLIATLPEHAKFVSSSPLPTNVIGNTYEYTLQSLAANSKQVVQLDVIPTAKLPLNIATEVQIQSKQQVAVAVQQPVLDVQVSGPQITQTGETIKHVVTVKNVGDGVAESVRIRSQLPQNLDASREPQKTLVPKLVPGQEARFELASFARTDGDADVVFEITADGADSRQGRTAVRVVRPELDVQLLGPSQNFLGREGIYSIEVQNPGELGINDVNIGLKVPAGLEINTISQQAKIDRNSGDLSWNFKSIPGGQQQIIQFRAKAISAGNQTFNINVASKETGARQLSLNTDVYGRADLSIRVIDSGEPVAIGNKSQFTIEVANHGSSNADQVSVQVELPGALQAVNQPGYSVDPSGNYITFNTASVVAGGKQTFEFTVVAVTAGEHIVRGSVSLDGSMQTISSENSVFVFESENARVSEAIVPDVRR